MASEPTSQISPSLNASHALADAVPNLVFLLSAEGEVTYANRAFTDYAGLDSENLSPDALWRLIVHPDERAYATAASRRLLAGTEAGDFETRLRRHDGAYQWHQLRYVRFRPDSDMEAPWIVLATDIEDKHQAVAMRRFYDDAATSIVESRDYLEGLHDLVNLIVPARADICAIDLTSRDGVSKRLAVACADPTKTPIVQTLRVRDLCLQPAEHTTVADTILHGDSVYLASVDLEAVTADLTEAERRNILYLGARSAIFVPLRARGRTIGALALVLAESGRSFTQDELTQVQGLAGRVALAITNASLYATYRRVANQLSRANRAKTDFLSLMSHELRTPLTTIYGNAGVLQRLLTRLDHEALASALADIKTEAEDLRLIVENILALARNEGPQTAAEPVMIARVLESLANEHRRSHPERRLRLFIDDKQTCVCARPSQIELVVRNLLNNAERYSPPDQPINLRLQRHQTEATVHVLDRGHGIAADEIEAIFQPFFRSPQIRDRISGVGIGLTVCKRLLEVQGGRIWAEQRRGGGLEIAFSLPLETPLYSDL